MNTSDTPIVTDIDRPILVPPGGHKKVLLHSCCAPCSGEVMEAMLATKTASPSSPARWAFPAGKT